MLKIIISVCTCAVTWCVCLRCVWSPVCAHVRSHGCFFNMVQSAVASHVSAQAGARTDGTSRDQRTRIINAYLKREGGKLVPQPHHPLFEQILVDQKKKFFQDTTAGCVRWSVKMSVLG